MRSSLRGSRSKELAPSPEADKRTLIRRVTLDLTGLPPTPAEVRAFLADKSPNAYEKVVDRLLQSPHYGERMAVPWLDAVRYADTVGFHGDQNQNAWAYRDYVVDSFNKNKPFDRFTIEQIAGDLLPNATPETRAATAFNRLTMMTREGGAQPKEYLAKYAADRVRTVSMTFLGSTFACAECHDHKFDPISQKDFYALAAFFADVKQWGVYADYGYTPNPDLKGYNNDYPFPPEIKIGSRYLRERIARGQKRINEVAAATGPSLKNDSAAQAAFDDWHEAARAFLTRHPNGWDAPAPSEVRLAPVEAKGKKAENSAGESPAPLAGHRVLSDNSVLLSDGAPANVEIALRSDLPWLAALRIEALPDPANNNSIFRQGRDAGHADAFGKPAPGWCGREIRGGRVPPRGGELCRAALQQRLRDRGRAKWLAAVSRAQDGPARGRVPAGRAAQTRARRHSRGFFPEPRGRTRARVRVPVRARRPERDHPAPGEPARRAGNGWIRPRPCARICSARPGTPMRSPRSRRAKPTSRPAATASRPCS
jgi:hypothetical protein